MSPEPDEKPHVPSPSLWPIGFAIGVACVLVGLVVSVPAVVVGAVLAVVFGWLWVRDLFRVHGPVTAAAPGMEELEVEPEVEEIPAYDRSMFLSTATIGLGSLIGGLVTVPVLGFAVLPAFTGQDEPEVDLGPITNFKEGEFVIATYLEDPAKGEVTRRTAYVRNNGPTSAGVPSFTILFSRCVHLGCPVQPNGKLFDERKVTVTGEKGAQVELTPTLAGSFGCPCHGSQFDAEGNRTAGPPVRSLDRYSFAIRNGKLVLTSLYSVGTVEGAGANAKIRRYDHSAPGVHVDGIERWLYPIPVPK